MEQALREKHTSSHRFESCPDYKTKMVEDEIEDK
jgi:hypothetical protein